jgi:hypothetical protein
MIIIQLLLKIMKRKKSFNDTFFLKILHLFINIMKMIKGYKNIRLNINHRL